MEWVELTKHLSGLANMATATPLGDPHVSMVLPVVDGDALWVFTNASSGKAKRVAANGRVALMWRPGPEVYLYGIAEVVRDGGEKRRMWSRDDLPFDPAMFFGAVDNPDHVLLRISPTRATVLVQGEQGIQRLTWHR